MTFKDLVDKKYEERVLLTAPIEPVDALTFITSHKWLGERPFPFQSLVLKLLYGLWEKYPITEEEQKIIDILKTEWNIDLDLEHRNAKQVIEVLILVIGRRGSKSSVVSWIASYEAYKLVCKGNPQKYYNIRERHPIHILNCASDGEQAKETFNLIKDNIKKLEFFQKYIDFEKDNETELRVFSPYDLFLNSQIKKFNEGKPKGSMKKNLLRGSICIESVTTSAATKRGKAIQCVSGDTLIFTEKGIIPIRDVVQCNEETVLNKKIQLYGNTGKAITSHVMCSGEKESIKITTKFGFDLVGTRDHKILTMSSENNIEYKELNSLKEGDWVYIQKGQNYFGNLKNFEFNYNYWDEYKGNKEKEIKCEICGKFFKLINEDHLHTHKITLHQYKERYAKTPLYTFNFWRKCNRYKDVKVPKKMSKELARLLGYLVAEGNVTEKTQISISNTNKEILNDIKYCIKKCFPDVKYIYEKSTSISKFKATKKCFSIIICSKKVRKFLEFIGIDYVNSYKKEIPWCILQSPKEIVKEFLKAYFDGDGCVEPGDKNSGGCLSMHTVSEKLAHQLQILLLNFGIISSKRTIKRSNVIYAISVHSNDILLYAKEIGTLHTYNTLRLDFLVKKLQKRKHSKPKRFVITVEKGIWDKIVKKENSSRQLMYDVTVPKTHNFTSNGFISHNCLSFDEMAHFSRSSYRKRTLEFIDAPQTDHAMWVALTPSVKDFGDDGLIIAISSPSEKAGEFYSLYCSAGGKEQTKTEEVYKNQKYLMLQLATWEANPKYERKSFDDDFRKDPVSAAMEYGAHFGEPSSTFLNPEKIDNMVIPTAPILLKGRPGQLYIITVDPASKSDTYAIAWGHREDRPQERYWIDGLKGFEPTVKLLEDGKIVMERIDPDVVMEFLLKLIANLSVMGKQVIEICYDQWSSIDSVNKLRKMKLPAFETTFTNSYKSEMFGTFLEQLNQNNVFCYGIDESPLENWPGKLKLELKYLQKIISGGTVYYAAPTSGPVTSDDFCVVSANLIHRLNLRKDMSSKVIRELHKSLGGMPISLGTSHPPTKGGSLWNMKKGKNLKDRVGGKRSFDRRNW